MRVFIVDDDPSFRKLLEIRLRAIRDDLTFLTASNLKEARDLLSTTTEKLDLVMLDQHLPDGRGPELLNEKLLNGSIVFAVSSDNDPEIPGKTIGAGAAYFLSKDKVLSSLFPPLVEGLIERSRLESELQSARLDQLELKTIKTLVDTLRHEINNPLGAVLGAAYLIKSAATADPQQLRAAQMIEESGIRIKSVLERILSASEIAKTERARHELFLIPGDEAWEK